MSDFFAMLLAAAELIRGFLKAKNRLDYVLNLSHLEMLGVGVLVAGATTLLTQGVIHIVAWLG